MVEQQPHETTEQPHGDHERTDISTSAVAKFAGVLVAFIVVCNLIVLVLLTLMTAPVEEKPVPETRKRIKLPRDLKEIPPPRLRVDETADLKTLEAVTERMLEGYRWVDKKEGIVQIPIEDAMEILADPKKAPKHGIKWEKQN